MNPRPVAITGLGAVCSIGTSVDAIREALITGGRGIGPLQDLSLHFPENVFGQVKLANEQIAELCGVDRAENWSRTALLALLAAREALTNTTPGEVNDLAIISASTVGGMDLSERRWPDWSRVGDPGDVSAALSHPVGDHTVRLARALGSEGLIATISTACSSSANAILFGARLIQEGLADRVLAGGADALCGFTIEGFRSLGAIDPRPTRPFSEDRAGLNLGEGAAYLVLEPLDRVRAEGRSPIALFAGGANTNDAHHQTATSPDGRGPFEAMSTALRNTGLRPGDIDHINAHGTGTGNNDDTELTAIERLFDPVPPFCSTKAFTGHTLGAAGALEAVFSVLGIRHGFIPCGFAPPAPMSGHRSMPVTITMQCPVHAVLSNSFGFGGNDTALVFTSPDR